MIAMFRITDHHGPEDLVTFREIEAPDQRGKGLGCPHKVSGPAWSQPHRIGGKLQVGEGDDARRVGSRQGLEPEGNNHMRSAAKYPVFAFIPCLDDPVVRQRQ